MAESVKASEDPKVAADVIAEEAYQRVKLTTGADGTATDVSEAAPVPVSDAGGKLSVDDGGGTISVDDNGATLSVDDGGGSLTVDGTVAVSGTVPVSSADLGTTTDAESESGNGTVIALLKRLRKLLEGTGKIIVTKIEGELPEGTKALGKVKVSTIEGEPKVKVSALEGEPAVKVGGELPTGTKSIGKVKALEEALPAGANAIGKLAANSGVDIGDVDVTSLPELPAGTKAIGQTDPRGNKAHDEVDAGNPIKVGAKGVTVLPAAVSTGDRTDALSDKFGRQLGTVAPLDQRVSGTTNFTNETAADVIAAPGASTALVITGIKVVNNHATVKTKVEILNDSTKIDLGAAGVNGGGWVVSDPNGLFPPLTTNKALRAKCLTTGADVDVTAYGYKIPA